jgi:hypothetical protein
MENKSKERSNKQVRSFVHDMLSVGIDEMK